MRKRNKIADKLEAEDAAAARVHVEALSPTAASLRWAQARSFLVDHLPHSWKLFGPFSFQ
jgi:hypothetical protein